MSNNRSINKSYPRLFVYLLIVAAMVLVPISTMLGSYSMLVWTAFTVIIYWLAFSNRGGFSLIFLSLCLCEPGAIQGDIDMALYNDSVRFFYYFLFIIPTSLSLFCFIKKKAHLPRSVIAFSVLFIVLSVIYSDVFVGAVYRVVAVTLSFYVCSCDYIEIQDFYKGFFLIFIISIIYGALDYHLGVTPYTPLFFQDIDSFVGVNRASGLLGNPLILCVLVILTQALLLLSIRYLPSCFFIILELVCIYGAVIVVSRSAVFAVGIIFICYAYMNRKRIKTKYVTAFIFICILSVFLISSYLSGSIEDLVYRFTYSDRGHRVSSLGTVANIMSKHPLGIGFKDYAINLQKFAGAGKEAFVDTLDNMILTQFAHFGLLAIPVLCFYFGPFIHALRRFQHNQYEHHFFLLGFIAVLLSAMIFDFEAYNNVNMLIYGILGFFYGYFRRVRTFLPHIAKI